MSSSIDNYQHLWTTEAKDCVLVNYKGKSAIGEYWIINLPNRSTYLIEEDGEIMESIVRRMIAAGVPVQTELPEVLRK